MEVREAQRAQLIRGKRKKMFTDAPDANKNGYIAGVDEFELDEHPK